MSVVSEDSVASRPGGLWIVEDRCTDWVMLAEMNLERAVDGTDPLNGYDCFSYLNETLTLARK
jgi:hypothetical protein